MGDFTAPPGTHALRTTRAASAPTAPLKPVSLRFKVYMLPSLEQDVPKERS
jgi:hypothetical protein